MVSGMFYHKLGNPVFGKMSAYCGKISRRLCSPVQEGRSRKNSSRDFKTLVGNQLNEFIEFYHPPTKLLEGNVFRRACHSVHWRRESHLWRKTPGQRPPTQRPPRQRPPHRDVPRQRPPPPWTEIPQRPPWTESPPD